MILKREVNEYKKKTRMYATHTNCTNYITRIELNEGIKRVVLHSGYLPTVVFY